MTFRSLREKTWTYGQTHGQYVPTAQQRDKALDELEAVSLTIEVIVLYGTTRWLTKPTSTAKHFYAEQGQDGRHSEDQLATRWLNNATSTAIHIYTKQGQDGLHPEDQQATRWLNNATSTAIHIYAEQGQDGLHPEDQQAGRFPEGQHVGLEMKNEKMSKISVTLLSLRQKPWCTVRRTDKACQRMEV